MSAARSATRAVMRQSTKLTGRSTRRFESTTTSKAAEAAKDTASKASDAAAQYKTKASEGLSKATATAGPAITNVAKRFSQALARFGGPIGRLATFVETKVPTAIYYTRVGLELSKLVIQGQKMSPPSIATFQTYYNQTISALRNGTLFKGSSSPQSLLEQAKNLKAAQLAAGGVVVAEVVGFFTVGEIIGRRKIIGYRGETAAHH